MPVCVLRRVHETCAVLCVTTAQTHALVRPYAFSTCSRCVFFFILVCYTTLAAPSAMAGFSKPAAQKLGDLTA